MIKRKKKEKTLALPSTLARLIVNSKEDKLISGDDEGVEHYEVERNVSEGTFLVDDTKKEVTADKRGAIKL